MITYLSLDMFVPMGLSLIQSMWLKNRQLQAWKLESGYVEVQLSIESFEFALHVCPHFLEVINKVSRERFHQNTLHPGTKYSR